MSVRASAVTLLAALTSAAGCLTPISSRVGVQDPAIQSSMAVMALEREDFASARPPRLELVGRCQSGEYGRRAVLLLAAAELDTGNEAGSPQAALQLARSYLLLPDAPPEEVVVARALYRMAADLGGSVEAPATSDSAPRGFHVAPRFDECDSVPDLMFRPLPSTSAETMAERERALEATVAARADSLTALKSALAASDHRVTELQSELDRITQLLTSGAERHGVDRQ